MISKDSGIVIYSKDNCQYCTKAVALLSQKGYPYKLYKLDEDFTREELKQDFPTARSFPVITVEHAFIGGYDSLTEMVKNNAIPEYTT